MQAFVFEGCNIGTHQSAHNNLYRRKPLDYLAGMAWAVPVIYSYAAYRTSHLEHHKNAHDPERDSEPVYEKMTLVDYIGYMALSGIAYTFILLLEGAEAALGKGKAWMRTGRRRWLAALSTFVVLAELGLVPYGSDAAPMLTLEPRGAVLRLDHQPPHGAPPAAFGARPEAHEAPAPRRAVLRSLGAFVLGLAPRLPAQPCLPWARSRPLPARKRARSLLTTLQLLAPLPHVQST